MAQRQKNNKKSYLKTTPRNLCQTIKDKTCCNKVSFKIFYFLRKIFFSFLKRFSHKSFKFFIALSECALLIII